MGQNRRNRRQRRNFDFISAGKFFMAALIVVYVVCLFIFASGSSRTFEEVAGPVDGMINKKRMVKAGERDVKKFYGLNINEYEGVLCYVAKNNLSAEEVLVVKVKDPGQVKEVKDAVYNRLDNRKEDFKGYAPEEERYIDDAIVSVRGNFIFMAVGPDSEQQKDIFFSEL